MSIRQDQKKIPTKHLPWDGSEDNKGNKESAGERVTSSKKLRNSFPL